METHLVIDSFMSGNFIIFLVFRMTMLKLGNPSKFKVNCKNIILEGNYYPLLASFLKLIPKMSNVIVKYFIEKYKVFPISFSLHDWGILNFLSFVTTNLFAG